MLEYISEFHVQNRIAIELAILAIRVYSASGMFTQYRLKNMMVPIVIIPRFNDKLCATRPW